MSPCWEQIPLGSLALVASWLHCASCKHSLIKYWQQLTGGYGLRQLFDLLVPIAEMGTANKTKKLSFTHCWTLVPQGRGIWSAVYQFLSCHSFQSRIKLNCFIFPYHLSQSSDVPLWAFFFILIVQNIQFLSETLEKMKQYLGESTRVVGSLSSWTHTAASPWLTKVKLALVSLLYRTILAMYPN